MKTDIQMADLRQQLIYVTTYTACLVFTPVVLSFASSHGVSLWRDWRFYLPLFVAGLAASFGRHKVRNLAFLLQVPTALLGAFSLWSGWFFANNHSHYVVTTTLLIGVFFVVWHVHSHANTGAWPMAAALILGCAWSACGHALHPWHGWDAFLGEAAQDLSALPVYTVAILLSAVVCQAQEGKHQVAWASAVCVCAFVGGLWIAPALQRKGLYGTFTGRTCVPVRLNPQSPDEEPASEAFTFEGHQVCYFTYTPTLLPTKMFIGLAAMFNNRPVRFAVVGLTSPHTQAGQFVAAHRTMHVKLPLYLAPASSLAGSPLQPRAYGRDFICVFKNDTLLYIGAAQRTDRAARFIAQQLQP